MNSQNATSDKTAVVKRDEKAMEYIPFGSADKIKLSIEIVQTTIAIPTASGKLPQIRDIVKFMMMCQAQRLNPFAGDAYLCGYDGKDGPTFSLITANQALLKRAEASDHFLGMTSGIIVVEGDELKEVEGDFYTKDQVVVGGWAKVYHAKRKDYPFYRRIRLERFNTGFAQWKKDEAGMICKCAEADALRSAFPTMLGGLYVAEEQTLPTDIVDSTERIADGKVRKLAPPTADAQPQLGDNAARTAQQDLESAIIERGFEFSLFQRWGIESGNIENADSLPGFDAVPTETANRLLRNKAGLLKSLGEMKGGA